MGKYIHWLLQKYFIQNIVWFGVVLLTLSFLSIPSFAQLSVKKDSLLKVLETLPDDTNKVNLLNKLSSMCRANDSENSIKYANQSLNLSRRVKYVKGEGRALDMIGQTNRILGNYDQALKYFKLALTLRTKYKLYRGVAGSTRNIGIVYRLKADFPKALEYYLQALKIFDRINDFSGQASTSSSIGSLYYKQKNLDKALQYYIKALSLHKKSNSKPSIARALNNIGNVLSDQKKYKEAIKSFQNSLSIKESLEDSTGAAKVMVNLGYAYKEKKELTLALKFFKESLRIFQNSKLLLYQTYPLQYIADIYASEKKVEKAKSYGIKALKIAKDLGAKERVMDINLSLSSVFELEGDFQESLKYYRAHKMIQDSIFNVTKSKQVADMQTKYETDKKEQENKILKLEVKQRSNQIVAATIGAFLLLVLAVVLYRSNRRKHKTNKVLLSQKQEIEIQTEEIMAQRDMLEQQHKDIRDSINYARKIQTAILPLKEEISAALPEHFLFYQPRDIVSGDFYWFAKIGIESPKYVMAISDCTGHGVPGAFMSMIGNDLLNDIVKARQILAPDVILDLLHEGVRKALHQETGENTDGMDISLCVIDPQQKTVSYAGANSPLVYVQNGELTRVAPNKTSIGGSKTKTHKGFMAHSISYQDAPVMCYLYSDGYRDQFGGEKGKKFMRPRFLELVFYISQMNMQDQRRQVEETITDWMKQGGYDQMDDMLVMGFRLS